MSDHVIDVTFAPGGHAAIAIPNPSPTTSPQTFVVSPGDTVTWRIDPPQVLHVKFKLAGPSPLHPNPINRTLFVPSPPMGPFNNLAVGSGAIVGTVRSNVPSDVSKSQRFIYDLVDTGGNSLTWANGILDGGIDIPRTPP